MLAITEASLVTIVVASIAAVSSIVSARRAARTEQRVRTVNEQIEVVDDKVDTGNGQDIGHTVRQLAQTSEVLSAQIHTNTKETVALASKVDVTNARLDEHLISHQKKKRRR